jgi:hypothetical protein
MGTFRLQLLPVLEGGPVALRPPLNGAPKKLLVGLQPST